MIICGIDPSINSTGKCIMRLNIQTFAIDNICFYGYTSVKKNTFTLDNVDIEFIGSKYSSYNMFDRQDKAYSILMKDMELVDYVAFEGYAFGANKTNSIFQLGEFIGGMKKMFYDMKKGIVIYPPSVVKRFATGNGTADKSMMAGMFRQEHPALYPQIFNSLKQNENPHSDLCDAFWIAETLRNHLIYDKLGERALNGDIVSLLEYKTGSKVKCIAETEIFKKNEN